MQNFKINIYISDLLYKYDCVVVPDFGGFVANYASARIHAIQHQFTPPSKEVSFNKNLKNNDGLLSNHIALRKEISYEDANQLIQSFVNQSIQGLQRGDKIHIEKVGTLFLDPERNIQFVAEDRNDYLLDSFGLSAFKALPIQREGAEERIQKRIQESIPLLKEEEKKKRKYYWPAAALLIVVLSSGLFLNQQFSWVNGGELYHSTLNSLDRSENKTYYSKPISLNSIGEIEVEKESDLIIEEGIVSYKTSTGKVTNLFIDNRKEDLTTEIDNTEVVKSTPTNGLRFHVMGGCFSKLSNAKGLVRTLKSQGFKALLLGNYKNLHAVSFGSFATREEAINLLAQVRNGENPNAWLLVKPF